MSITRQVSSYLTVQELALQLDSGTPATLPVQIIQVSQIARRKQYREPQFFNIVNCELVLYGQADIVKQQLNHLSRAKPARGAATPSANRTRAGT